MTIKSLEDLLEDPARAPFYDLMGGLADNLLTIGPYAGSFLCCAACGETFSAKAGSWKCEGCGQDYELKFRPVRQPGATFRATVDVSGLEKARLNPQWYFENENWSVAEFLTQLMRLGPESLLPPWLERLGIALGKPAALETVLSWPRFRFAGAKNTIQPDLAIAFRSDLILFEFKRPMGGLVPPYEVMGQLAFAMNAARKLSRQWHLVIIPGNDASSRTAPIRHVERALEALSKANEKWSGAEPELRAVQTMPAKEIADRVIVLGWEELIRRTAEVIARLVPESWAKRQALAKLHYFYSERAKLGLLAPPAWSPSTLGSTEPVAADRLPDT